MAKAKKGAEAGDPESMFNYGTSFGNDSKKALPWLEKSAAAGWGQAMSTLGSAWTHGSYGAGVDIPKGIAWFEKAIAAGETTWAGQPLAKHLQKARLALKKSGVKPVDPVAAAFAEAKLTAAKAKILAAVLPSVRWLAEPHRKDDLPLGASKLGGGPDLPATVEWPKTKQGRALEHVATLDLSKLPAIKGVPRLSGRLLFFLDEKNLFDSELENAVLHIPAGAKSTRRKSPRGTMTFKPSSLTPKVEDTIPAASSHACRALPIGKTYDRYLNLRDSWPPHEKGELHRSFGHGDVEHEAKEPEPLLLLQVDSYSHGNIMWGDAGKLFWWISPADLKASRFARARLTVHF